MQNVILEVLKVIIRRLGARQIGVVFTDDDVGPSWRVASLEMSERIQGQLVMSTASVAGKDQIDQQGHPCLREVKAGLAKPVFHQPNLVGATFFNNTGHARRQPLGSSYSLGAAGIRVLRKARDFHSFVDFRWFSVVTKQLNQRANHLAAFAASRIETLRIKSHEFEEVNLLDFGVKAEGGLEAGLLLARLCLSGMADVSVVSHDSGLPPVPQVFVRTDHPVAACLMSQYAGWKIATDDYFAMGSGPMRALVRKEDLFHHLPETEDGRVAVGVLESGSLPSEAAIAMIRKSLPESCRLTLAVAPTASQAGNMQVVARSVETALHKLHELHFPLEAIVSGSGVAPLPPVAKDDLHGIGRTNDSILYGATVNLWVRCDDDQITSIGPKVPSNASSAHGQTFLSLFKAANHDFYAMDAALFSPAVVVFHNLKTGRTFSFGQRMPEILAESFGMST